MSRPNIFLLVIDSLRADVTFESRVPTPNIDGYASRGASFHQCISTTTTTTPSFSSILTGCYPPKHGVRGLRGYRLSPAVTTMAEVFSRAGYHTYAEVTGPLFPETDAMRGFTEARHRDARGAPFFGWRDRVVNRMHSYAEPWLMLLHVWEVHGPYRSPPDFAHRHDRAGYEAAVAATDEWLSPVFEATGENTIIAITGDHGERFPDTRREHLLRTAVHTGRRVLRPSKWAPALNRKFFELAAGHGFGLEESVIRVPLIMSGPRIRGVVVEQQVRHIDLLPTLLDLCGIDPPKGIDGHSLRPLIDGGSMLEEAAYMEAVGVKLGGRRITGVRTSEWKLLKREGKKPKLFRLAGGGRPDERRNLYGRHPDVASRLQAVVGEVENSAPTGGAEMTPEEEALVEKHLRDLGYLG